MNTNWINEISVEEIMSSKARQTNSMQSANKAADIYNFSTNYTNFL